MPTSKSIVKVSLRSTPDRSYPVWIQPGLLNRLPSLLSPLARGATIYIITDNTVRRLYGRRLHAHLSLEEMNAVLLDFPSGEESKSARVIEGLQTALLYAGVKRNSLIVALGGGVVGDVAGFVAATVLRGIRYVQVPTTLLAQVDSSVGGKVGINHEAGKNLIGAFHQPSVVFIDPETLSTLPAEEFRNGLAEMVKIGAVLDRTFFARLERAARTISPANARLMARLITTSVGLKAAVVARDERETGLRKVLNAGHTIGHAVEAATGYRIPHGHAVAVGLAAEAEIAEQMGFLKKSERVRVTRLLRSLRLPVRIPPVSSSAEFFSALSLDKKSDAQGVRYVLLNGIGRSVIGVQVPVSLLSAVCRLSA